MFVCLSPVFLLYAPEYPAGINKVHLNQTDETQLYHYTNFGYWSVTKIFFTCLSYILNSISSSGIRSYTVQIPLFTAYCCSPVACKGGARPPRPVLKLHDCFRFCVSNVPVPPTGWPSKVLSHHLEKPSDPKHPTTAHHSRLHYTEESRKGKPA